MFVRHIRLVCLIGMLGLVLARSSAGVEEPAKLHVLLLSGQNNHDWRQTTPLIQQVLEGVGCFVVDVTEQPESITAEKLRRYDVIVSNWNCFHRDQPPPVIEWPPETRRAYVDFVREGKGFVVVHAGSSSFYKHPWPEYQEIAIARYGFGQTGHGIQHVFAVQIDKSEHPIVRGMREFYLHDELWHAPEVVPGATVLASAFSASETKGSGEYEPVVFVRPYGRGRCFTIMLGHGPRTLLNPAFGALLTRGTQWAATGEVTIELPERWPTTSVAAEGSVLTLERAFDEMKTYRFGDDRLALQVVAAVVTDAANDVQRRKMLADRLETLLQADEITLDGRRFCCEQLGLIGSAEHIDTLTLLLKVPAMSDSARTALERIGCSTAMAALRNALPESKGTLRLGLVNSLGDLQDREAVPLVVELLDSDQDRTNHAAVLTALGRIASPAAATSLIKARSYLDNDEKLVHTWAEACLMAADRLRRSGDRHNAKIVYATLSNSEHAAHVRVAALTGQFACHEQLGGDELWKALLSHDSLNQQAALCALHGYGGEVELCGLAERLSDISEELKAPAVALLADRNVKYARSSIEKICENSNPQIRREAFRALGIVGNAASIPVLLKYLDKALKEETRIITDSLTRLQGPDVNSRMIDLMGTAEPEQAAVLAKVLSARQAAVAAPAVMFLARHSDARVAEVAVRAVGELGNLEQCLDLLVLLDEEDRVASADMIRIAVVQTARRSAGDPTAPVLDCFENADQQFTVELLAILGLLGGERALEAVAIHASSSDEEIRLAAVRALASWADPAALPSLVDVANTHDGARETTLALRGVARLLPQAGVLSPEQRSEMLRQAITAARSSDDKRALLGCLTAGPSVEALAWAGACLDDAAVTSEAELAILTLAELLYEEDREETLATLQSLLASSKNTAARIEALRLLSRAGVMEDLARGANADSPDDLDPDLGGQDAQAVNDGDLSTYWDEENDQEMYRLRLSFAQPSRIAALAITGYRHHYAAPKTFAILCDGRKVTDVQDLEYTDNVALIEIPATICSVLELEISGYYGPSPGIRELNVYAPFDLDSGRQFNWRRTDSAFSLLYGNQMVWTFHFTADLSKPYFHPIALPDGPVLTWAAPADHPWHHGHWFSWKYINGVNYWEENRETGQSEGSTLIRKADVREYDDHHARIVLDIGYAPVEGDTVLTEKRVIEVSPPGGTGEYYLDWMMKFTAEQDAVLDRTPISDQPNGKVWGGYAGLAFRLARDFRNLQAVTINGEVTRWEHQRHRSRAPAMEYHGDIDGRPVGIAILDHPGNLNTPSPWYLINSDPMRFMNPAVICDGPHTLKAGESFTLRYRVIVHPGHWNATDLQEHYEQYLNQQDAHTTRKGGQS